MKPTSGGALRRPSLHHRLLAAALRTPERRRGFRDVGLVLLVLLFAATVAGLFATFR